MEINEILRMYTTGMTRLEEANAALKDAGAGFHLEPGKNGLTEQDLRQTVVGYYPEQAHGFGLLDTGTGSLDKVQVVAGMLHDPVNEVMEDGSTNMRAYVIICGKTYEVLGDKLAEVREDCGAKAPPLPKTPDMSRRTDLAGRTVVQKTLSGSFEVRYDAEGYAVKASRKTEA